MCTLTAALYENPKGLIVYPEHRTSAGFSIAGEPYIPVTNTSISVLGAAVREALGASRSDIPVPQRSDYPNLARLRFRAAGVSSERAFMREARFVSVEKKEKDIILVPNRNGGATSDDRGFHPLIEASITVSVYCNDEELGEACVQALARCQT